jgi:hypothetical protein
MILLWRRGWDSNPVRTRAVCKLQILRCFQCQECHGCRRRLPAIARRRKTESRSSAGVWAWKHLLCTADVDLRTAIASQTTIPPRNNMDVAVGRGVTVSVGDRETSTATASPAFKRPNECDINRNKGKSFHDRSAAIRQGSPLDWLVSFWLDLRRATRP